MLQLLYCAYLVQADMNRLLLASVACGVLKTFIVIRLFLVDASRAPPVLLRLRAISTPVLYAPVISMVTHVLLAHLVQPAEQFAVMV